MDREEQTRLFHQRLLPLHVQNVERNFYLETATAIMNDFPINVTDEDGFSFLHDICAVRNPEIYEPVIRQLIERGADINVYLYGSQDWWDVTPIVSATKLRQLGVLKFLLQYGPEVQETRALAVSVRNGDLDCMSILLEAGAHPHGPARHFHYPIDLAVVHKRLHVGSLVAMSYSLPRSHITSELKMTTCMVTWSVSLI